MEWIFKKPVATLCIYLNLTLRNNNWTELASTASCNGVHVSTCGHYVHHKCMEDYLRTVGRSSTSYENVIQNGFQCPMCRSQSNFILPVDFNDKINIRLVSNEKFYYSFFYSWLNQIKNIIGNYSIMKLRF